MDKLLTAKEVADLLHCHVQSVYKNTSIPKMHVPGVGVRFNSKDIENLTKNSRSDPLILDQSDYSKQLLYLHESTIYDRKKLGGLREMAKAKSKSRYNLGYGSVYERKTKSGNARWYLDYHDAEGKRIQKLVPHAISLQDAVLSLQSQIVRIFNQEYRPTEKEQPIKFDAFAEVYLSNYAKVKKKSWRSDAKYLNAQLVPFFGKLDLREITPLLVSHFMVKRQSDGVKESTINRELTVLKKMLSLAMEWGFELKKNPVAKGNYFSEEKYRRDRVLAPDEEMRLFQFVAPHVKPILCCALATGMRYSEILGLKWECVDLGMRQIVIKAESSKSGKQRIIPINLALQAILLRLKQMNAGMSDYVFLYEDPKSGKFRNVKTIRRAFTTACMRAEIKNFHFHDLRHTVGTRLIYRGIDPITVKNILGHANLKTTEIYMHSSMGQMAAAVEKLDDSSSPIAGNPAEMVHICDTKNLPEVVNIATRSSAVS